MSRSFRSSSSYLSEQELGCVMRIVTAGRLVGIHCDRRRKLHLGDVVEVQRQALANLVEQLVNPIRAVGRIGFQRDAVAFLHFGRESQLLHRHVLNATARVVDEFEAFLPQRIQVIHALVIRIWRQLWDLENRHGEQQN